MADSTLSMITSIAMIILFSIAIIGFSISFANDNNAAVRIDNNSDINNLYGTLNQSTDTFRTETESTYSSIINSTIEPGSDILKSPGAFTLTWRNLYSTLDNISDIIYTEVFGRNPIFVVFIGTFLTIITIMFTLYIIKAWRGNP